MGRKCQECQSKFLNKPEDEPGRREKKRTKDKIEMEEMTYKEKIEAVKNGHEPIKVSPWEITNSYGKSRRSWGLAEQVNRELTEQGLELSGDFYYAWFYAELLLQKKKDIATTRVTATPIKRVDSLAAATTHKPISVDKNDNLAHAITLMQQNGFSQLPVIDGDETNLCGYISWKTIGVGLWHNKKGDKVKDFMERDVSFVYLDTPLLDAIRVITAKKFAVVLNMDKKFSGFVTSSDVASEFFSITQAEAFLLLEQIELQIRMLINRMELSTDELGKYVKYRRNDKPTIDDLTFGGYCEIFEEPQYWEKLNYKNEHSDFKDYIEKVRLIRNRVMHFEPEGIEDNNMQILRNMARYLSEIVDCVKLENN